MKRIGHVGGLVILAVLLVLSGCASHEARAARTGDLEALQEGARVEKRPRSTESRNGVTFKRCSLM